MPQVPGWAAGLTVLQPLAREPQVPRWLAGLTALQPEARAPQVPRRPAGLTVLQPLARVPQVPRRPAGLTVLQPEARVPQVPRVARRGRGINLRRAPQIPGWAANTGGGLNRCESPGSIDRGEIARVIDPLRQDH